VLHIALVGLAVVGAASLVVSGCAGLALLLPVTAGRRRPRGGDPRQPASLGTNPVTVSTTSGTQNSVVYISSRRPPGSASAGVAIQPTPPRPNSGTALGFSGTDVSAGTVLGLQLGRAV
jgi:hypothetical protein